MGSDSWWSGEDFSSGFSRQMTSKKEAVPAGVEEVRHFVKERDVSTLTAPRRFLEVADLWCQIFFFNKTYFFRFFSAEGLHLLFFLILKHQFRRLTCVTGSSNLGLTITTFQGSK